VARILVVDDEQHIRLLVATILKQHGYRVVEAANGMEALRYLEEDRNFALLITDIRMPQMDGIQLTGAVRKQFPALPIIVMSAYLNESQEALTKGATSFLPKPFSYGRLLSALPTLMYICLLLSLA
jgi:CheY-like chemotaxis protein